MTSAAKVPRMVEVEATPISDAVVVSSDRELLLDRCRPSTAPFWSYLPVLKTFFFTLDISSRFLLSLLVGKGTRERADKLIDGYWKNIVKSGNARLWAEGRHHFSSLASRQGAEKSEQFVVGEPCIVMSNHGSLLDIPALMGTVPGSLRMVLKEELTRVPVWGQALVASGFIPINRKNRNKAIAQLDKAKRMLRSGITVWISPEGTRARDGMLAPFKRGGFHIAADLGVPIIPAYIDGAETILPPDQWRVLSEGDVVVRFGAPIHTAGLELTEVQAKVRASILALSGRADQIDSERVGSERVGNERGGSERAAT